jgi:peptidoglycan/LPS O-acetylase OafA/YrhL
MRSVFHDIFVRYYLTYQYLLEINGMNTGREAYMPEKTAAETTDPNEVERKTIAPSTLFPFVEAIAPELNISFQVADPGVIPEKVKSRKSPKINSYRDQTLDVVRGGLSWVVVVVHVAYLSGLWGNLPVVAGAWAVQGFMVLSGFVITQLLILKKEPYGTFILRRYMRLIPAFAVGSLLGILVHPFVRPQDVLDGVRIASEFHYFWADVMAHLTLLHGIAQAWIPAASQAFDPPGWSIGVEFQFYLAAPLLLWILLRWQYMPALLVIGIPTLFHLIDSVNNHFHNIQFLNSLMYFLFGMCIYFMSGRAAATNFWERGILRRSLVRLGEISYSTYVVHWPVMALLNEYLLPNAPKAIRCLALFAVAAPIILVLSALLYRYVEKPGIALGRRLTQKR